MVPRGFRHSQSLPPIEHHGNMLPRGFRHALNWAPIIPRGVSRSDNRGQKLLSGIFQLKIYLLMKIYFSIHFWISSHKITSINLTTIYLFFNTKVKTTPNKGGLLITDKTLPKCSPSTVIYRIRTQNYRRFCQYAEKNILFVHLTKFETICSMSQSF